MVAYTSSTIKFAILRLFVRCDVILPNAFIGTLTRESVTEALKLGIDHEAIICYLTQHADPHVAASVPVVPAVSHSCCYSIAPANSLIQGSCIRANAQTGQSCKPLSKGHHGQCVRNKPIPKLATAASKPCRRDRASVGQFGCDCFATVELQFVTVDELEKVAMCIYGPKESERGS